MGLGGKPEESYSESLSAVCDGSYQAPNEVCGTSSLLEAPCIFPSQPVPWNSERKRTFHTKTGGDPVYESFANSESATLVQERGYFLEGSRGNLRFGFVAASDGAAVIVNPFPSSTTTLGFAVNVNPSPRLRSNFVPTKAFPIFVKIS